MNTGIKTCTKCGAKNFLEFKTCFNCGGTEFVVSKSVVPPTTEEVNKRAPVGLQHVSLQQRVEPRPAARPAERVRGQAEPWEQETARSAPRPQEAARPMPRPRPEAGVQSVPGERLERVQRAAKTVPPERRTIFDPGREIKRPLSEAEKEERVKNAVRRPVERESAPTPSKLNMQAQQERLKIREERAAEEPVRRSAPDAVLNKIVDKLESLERRLDQAPAGSTSYSETQALRDAVSEDMARLDEAIAELKSGNREVLDVVVNAQREQIERLEREQAEAVEKLREAGEERGERLGRMSSLDEEKRSLETQLAAERERFDLLLKDRETFKQLAVMNQPDLPGEYVVFTGEQTDPDYLEYARRQFLKIYPKIDADGDKEDVIYYIPGEFKNPPVLVLNPNVSRPNKRDIKINFIDPNLGVEETVAKTLETQKPRPEADEDGFGTEGREAEERPLVYAPVAPPVIPVESGAEPGESVGEFAARESVTELLRKMREEEAREKEERRLAAEAAKEEASADDAQKTFSFEDVLRAEDVLSPRKPDVSGADKPKERPAPEKKRRRPREKKWNSLRPMAVSLVLGALFLISLAALALEYFGDDVLPVKGYDVVTAVRGLFSEEALADNVFGLFIAASSLTNAPLAAMAKYLPLIVIGASAMTLAAGILCFVKPRDTGLVRALRIVCAALAMAADVFFTVCLSQSLGIQDVFGLMLPGLWVRLAADAALLIAGIVFMRVPRAGGKDEPDIKPLSITDKRIPEPEIELSQSLMRERDEIVGK